MSEERFNRIEGLFEQLISMVGNLNTNQIELINRMDSMEKRMESMEMRMDSMEKRMDSMEKRMESMEKRMDSMEIKTDLMESKGEERHNEIISRFKALEIDQDFIWEKTARNERELEVLKRRL